MTGIVGSSTSNNNATIRSISKVAVSFGETSIVVPVSADMTVADLIFAATLRFNRINQNNDKNNNANIRIKYLRSSINGGILYSADRLIHVVDDNDQLVAIYDDQSSSIHGTVNHQQKYVDNIMRVASQNGKTGNDQDDASKRFSTDSQLSMTEISHENNVCNIQIKSPSLSGQRSKKSNSKAYANENKFSDDPCLASNSVEVKNLNDIPASTSSLIVRRESEPAFNGQLPRRPTLVTGIKHKSQRDKSLSPVKLGVRWQAEEIPFEEDYKAPLPSSFSRGGARKSRVTDEMLDIAAQLAEKAQRNPSSSSEYLPEVNADSANQLILHLNSSKTNTVGNETSEDTSCNRKRISRSASPLLSSTSTSTTTTSQPFLSDLQKGNTKKLGRLVTVELIKGPEGLGFTVTSRDNARAGDNFTCVKNILPQGAALKDGRLREGDRLLKINDVDVAELSKEKVVAVLRSVSEDESVRLVVSRQGEIIASTATTPLPRFIPPEQSEQSKNKLRVKKRLTFDVPLNDSGSAGLGISVKGRTKRLDASEHDHRDNASNPESSCGIFVKLIIHGGAAYKDGRLKVNDQLLAINGTDLTGLSNKDAMNTLSSVMQRIDPNENSIRLTILRTLLDESLNVDPSLSELSKRDSSSFNILPGTPDGAASLLLETPRKNEQPVVADKSVEYAVIIKNNRRSDGKPPLPLLANEQASSQVVCRQNSNDSKPERLSSIADHSENRSETSAVEESDVHEDPFVRESRGRQSMSEKRRGASKIDPSNLATFQSIVHQRQTSAPSLVVKSKLESPPSKGNCPTTPAEQPVVDRKTLSLESISTINDANQMVYKRDKNAQKPLLHEQIAQNVISCGPKIADFRQTMSPKLSKLRSSPQRSRHTYHESANSIDGFTTKQRSSGRINSESPSSPHSVPHSRERGRKCTTSSGLSTLKNLFRFGSTGKSSKKMSIPGDNYSCPLNDNTNGLIGDEAKSSKLRAQEEQRRIRLQYERLKAQESKQQQPPDFRRKNNNIFSNNIPIFPDYSNYYRIPPSSSYHSRNSNYVMNDFPGVSAYEDAKSTMLPMSRSQPFAASFGQPMPPPDPAPHHNISHQSHNHPGLNVNHRQTIAVDYSPCGNRYEMDYYYQQGVGYRGPMVFADDAPNHDFNRLQTSNASQTRTNSADPASNEFFEPKPDYPNSVYKPFVSHAAQRSAPENWSSAENILDENARHAVDPVKYVAPRIPPPDYEEYLRFATTAMTSNKPHLPRSVNLKQPKFRPTSEFITYASPGPNVFFSRHPYDRRQFFGIQQQQQPPMLGSLHRNKDSQNVTRIHF